MLPPLLRSETTHGSGRAVQYFAAPQFQHHQQPGLCPGQFAAILAGQESLLDRRDCSNVQQAAPGNACDTERVIEYVK